MNRGVLNMAITTTGLFTRLQEINATAKKREEKDFSTETISRLKLIGLLQPGDKLNTTQITIDEPSIYNSFMRTVVRKETRTEAVRFAEKVLNDTLAILTEILSDNRPSCRAFSKAIIIDIMRAFSGLENFCKTYKDDPMFRCNIETLAQSIQYSLDDMRENYPSVFQDIETDILNKFNFEDIQSPVYTGGLPITSNDELTGFKLDSTKQAYLETPSPKRDESSGDRIGDSSQSNVGIGDSSQSNVGKDDSSQSNVGKDDSSQSNVEAGVKSSLNQTDGEKHVDKKKKRR